MNENELEYYPTPYLGASVWSKVTYSWIGDLLSLGRTKQLDLTDLHSPYSEIQCKNVTDELELEWQKELEKNPLNPNIIRPIRKLYGVKLMTNFLFIGLQEFIKILQPLFIALILKYFNGSIDIQETLIYAAIISVLAAFGGVLHHPYYYYSYKYGMKVRLALSGLLYRKILKVGTTRFDSKTGGDIANLLANDTDRVEKSIIFLTYMFVGPIQVVVVISVILPEIGFSFLSGFILLLAFVPFKAVLAKIYNNYRFKNSRITDLRISVLTEIMSAIKIIKMYCWEGPFTQKAKTLRNEELKYQLVINVLQAFSYSFDNILSLLMTFLNISAFISFTPLPLIPRYLVFSIGFYTRLAYSIGFNFSRSMTTLISALVSLKRINDFLLVKELCPANEKSYFGETISIKVKSLNFSWDTISEEIGKQDNYKPVILNLNNLSFNVDNGELMAVIGPVGAGKSTLLLGLIGELENYTGNIDARGKVAYISQQPWIFTASIKQNILFGNEYEKEKFDKIVSVCSLKKDIELLPFGEDTVAAEKGINLSGGQRARISMARALYSDADIYLFDDSLSAVDATVQKNLLKNCINGYLKDKIRILVTHHAQHLEYADKILILNEGRAEAYGSYEEISKFNLSSLNLMSKVDPNKKDEYDEIQEEENENEIEQEKEAKAMSDDMKAKQEASKKDRVEFQKEGSVSFKTYFTYFSAGGSFFGVINLLAVAILFIAAQSCMIMTDFWLSTWTTNEENFNLKNIKISNCIKSINLTDDCSSFLASNNMTKMDFESIDNVYPERMQYYYTYIMLAIASTLLILIRSLLYFLMCVRVSKKVYEKLFKSVKDTSIKFFELNPLGRILNRFTKDTNNMDDMICVFIFEFLHLVMIVSGSLFVPLIINYLIIIPLIPVAFVFVMIRNYFIATGRELKRLENIARSPILVHANSTVEGISTIRCSGKEDIISKEFEYHNDNHSRAYFAFYVTQRWFGLRLDILCSLFIICVLLFSIFIKDYIHLSTGKIGILMSYLFMLFDLFQWCIIMTTIIENLMTSVERIVEYTQLPTEHIKSIKKKPPKDWPSKGHITFEKVSLSYDKNLPDVLKKISLNISPTEKIGIVGRTGAGKSSFFQTIFRMYQPGGIIRIDGVDIKELNLFDLRSRLTIIPQEPILFSGSVRFNLDPFNNHDDLDLWNALELVNLKTLISEMNGRLDTKITSGGSNLSVGQKQLFCLARAIIKKTKILIIDEATANVDYKTDAIIQRSIREHFKDCTVLTIAHRLSTVVDNDRILCLGEGEIKNFGKPVDLLVDETSVLYELTNKLTKNEKHILFDIINRNELNEKEKKKSNENINQFEETDSKSHVNHAAILEEE